MKLLIIKSVAIDWWLWKLVLLSIMFCCVCDRLNAEKVNEYAAVIETIERQTELKTRSIILENDGNNSILNNNKNDQINNTHHNDEKSIEEYLLEKILNLTNSYISSGCFNDLNKTIAAIRKRQPWAIAMYDATVKTPTGIEYGNIYNFGNFDQCIGINEMNKIIMNTDDDNGLDNHRDNVIVKYCLADVTINGYTVREGAVRNYQLTNSTVIHWGICVPASCTPNDLSLIMSGVTGYKNISIKNDLCHTNESQKFTTIDIVYGCVILVMISMVVFCSCYHIFMYTNSNYHKPPVLGGSSNGSGSFEQIIMSFSLIENLQKLVKGSRDEMGLSVVNGIKAFSMIFIIAGHALLFMVGGPTLNSEFYAKEIKLVQNAFLINSPLLVDTFLLLSGFLFSHLLLVELDKRNGKVNFFVLYIFRYIRLTPAYLAVIALYATWLPKLGSGPLWNSRMALEQERCQASWWINLLYINNYVGTDQLCMFQSWYLAADTQLFILAPLVLYPLWKCRKIGLLSIGLLTIISILIPFISTYINDTDPSFLPYADEITDLSSNTFFLTTYIKTHMRATSYLFGILTGFLIHYIKEKKIQFSRIFLWTMWILTILIGISSMFLIVIFFGTEYSRAIRSLYAGLHRLGWSLSTSWIVLASILGYAGPLKSILSSRALVPLSRLTYCAYLSNGLVELYQAASIRTPKYMSTINLLGETTSHIMITFIGAIILCLIFESPIHGIEKILLRKESQKRQRSMDSNLSPSSSASSTSTETA